MQARAALCVGCTNVGFAFLGLPIPSASFSSVVCISATIVPGSDLQGIYANFHCRYYAAMVQEEQFASSYRFVR